MTPSVLGLAINIRAIYLAMDNVRAIFNDSKGLPNTFTCSIVIHYRTVVFFFFFIEKFTYYFACIATSPVQRRTLAEKCNVLLFFIFSKSNHFNLNARCFADGNNCIESKCRLNTNRVSLRTARITMSKMGKQKKSRFS